MELRRIEVTGFGCLVRERLDFDAGRANVILARNEAGKSTLLAAIEVSLYGWPSARLAEGRELRRKFRPWAGGPSRLRLELRAGGHDYRIEHELLDGAGNERERMTVFRDEQEFTDAMRAEAESPGQWLLGLGRDDFRRSVLVRQGELELVARDTAQLVRHLESVVTSAEAGASATMAQQRLEAALEEYRARAGLERWAQTYLSRAKEWPRVESRLEKELGERQKKQRELDERRRAIERDVTALDASNARLKVLRRARECLRVVERAVRRRDLRRQIAADEDIGRQLAVLEQKIAALEDVADFPAERADELVRLVERETQVRRAWSDAGDAVGRARDEVESVAAEQAPLAAVAPLADQLDELVAQRALLDRALSAATAADGRWQAERRALVEAGLSLDRLLEAKARNDALAFEERQTILNLDRRRQDFDVALREHERQIEQVSGALAEIQARRDARRRQGLLAAVVAGAVGGTVSLLLVRIAESAAPAVIAGVLSAAGVVWGVVRAATAAVLHADRRAAQLAELERIRAAQQQSAENRQRFEEHVAGLAARQGLSTDALVAAVRDCQEHRDVLEAQDRAEREARAAASEAAQQRRWWAGRLAQVGRLPAAASAPDVGDRAAEAVDPPSSGAARSTPAKNGPVELRAAVAGLVADVQRYRTLRDAAARGARTLREAERALAERRRACMEAQAALRALLAAAGVPLPSAAPGDLVAAEELVAARREFDARRVRHEERRRALHERDALRRRQLGDDDRRALRLRAERAAADLAEVEAAAGPSAEALAWLQGEDADVLGLRCAAWSLDGLTGEAVTAAQEQVAVAIEAMQQAHARTWQDTRAFLAEYAERRRALEDELAELAAELERGRRFAAAVTMARTTLASVQASSYERWSERIRGSLAPLLDVLLPDYRLESVAADLSPVLVHRPTQARLTFEAIELHLSRGAKDRLFLALRLALAEVLGEERGVRLPLLLDDPLANWDDASLAGGLEMLCELGLRKGTLAVFTCQRSRCEAVFARSGAGRAPALHELAGEVVRRATTS